MNINRLGSEVIRWRIYNGPPGAQPVPTPPCMISELPNLEDGDNTAYAQNLNWPELYNY